MTIEGPGENHLQLNGECSLSSQELCRMFQLQPLDSVMSNHIRPSLGKDLFTDFSNRRVPVQKYKPRRIYWPQWEGWGVGKHARSVNFSKKKTFSGHKPDLDVNFCVCWSFLVGWELSSPHKSVRWESEILTKTSSWTLVKRPEHSWPSSRPPTPRRWGSFSLLCHPAFLFQTLWYVLEQP